MMKLAVSSKLFTLPNWITLGRILCVPFVASALLTKRPLHALIFFLLAAISDALDGFIARYMKARSKLGAYLDPLADKLLFFVTFLTLGYLKVIPFWLIVLSIYRDIIIVSGVGVLKFYKVPLEIKPLLISKLNTFIQSAVVLVFLIIKAFNLEYILFFIGAYCLVYINVITLLFSGLGYIRQGLQNLQGYGLVYLFSGVFIGLFILMMTYMIADGVIVLKLMKSFLYPAVYKV